MDTVGRGLAPAANSIDTVRHGGSKPPPYKCTKHTLPYRITIINAATCGKEKPLNTVRIFFSKTGDVRFISHLDVNRVMQRVIRRAKIPVWNTEGFNPHPYIVFALPTSLGFESLYEVMDIRLEAEADYAELKARLNEHLPHGFEVWDVAGAKLAYKDIASAVYEVTFDRGSVSPVDWRRFCAQDEITAEKKGKKGARTIDIKPYALSAAVTDKNPLKLSFTLPATQEANINPSLIVDAFIRFMDVTNLCVNILKRSLLTADGEPFR